ncbi:MAG: MFS transporter [Clostridia bacterium]
MDHKPEHYKRTTISCFVGIFIQAIIINLTAILFIPLMSLYNLSYWHLGLVVAVNFTAQVASDLAFSGIIDKVGFKRLVLPAHLLAFAGLLLFAATPLVFDDFLTGLIVSTLIFSVAGGLLEVLLSPIINGIPSSNKGPAMALMHSFYAWGQIATILLTTLFIFLFGKENWQLIVLVWAMVPLVNFFLFLFSTFPPVIHESQRMGVRKLIGKPFMIIALLAIMAGGATEVVMNQWSSTFMEKVLLLPKVTGDLLGMSGFALMLGLGRLLFFKYGAKANLHRILVLGSGLAVVAYIVVATSPVVSVSLIACGVCGLATSLLWPGTLVVTAEKYPLAGSWIFAFLAASGDIGAAVGPLITGFVTEEALVSLQAMSTTSTPEQMAIRAGILAAVVFPVATLACHIVLGRMKKRPV